MTQLTAGSLFSGIGGLDLGLERAGIKVIWQAEIDPQASQVLRRHWPDVPNLGDVSKVDWREVERPDIVFGGYPCQAISIAGQRRGLDDERWLWPEFARALRDLRPRYVLGENNPGLLTPIRVTDGAKPPRTLGFRPALVEQVFADLAYLGYRWAWRVLNSEFVGVAQRRQRVFLVGSLGDGADPSEVLFDTESGRWGPPPSRKAVPNASDPPRSGAQGGRWTAMVTNALRASDGGVDDNGGQAGHLVRVDGFSAPRVARSLTTSNYRIDGDTETFVAQCHGSNVGPMGTLRQGNGGVTGGVPIVAQETASPLTAGGHPNFNESGRHQEDDYNLVAFHMTQDPITEPELAPALGENSGGMGVAYPEGVASSPLANQGRFQVEPAVGGHLIPYRRATTTHGDGDPDRWEEAERSDTLACHSVTQKVAIVTPTLTVRRLTPTECERLQGFPDWHTAWGVNAAGKKVPQTDSARYRQLGNAVTVNVAEWIARRLVAAHEASEESS